MKTIILTIILAISSLLSQAQEQNGIDITVTINNIKNNNGYVLLGLHNQKSFMNKTENALQHQRTIIADGKVTAVFKNVSEGEFAIMAVHDENANNRMDFELSGMPKEAYGMSNNNMSFGPPLFNDAKFTVGDENLNFNIRF